MADEGEDSKGEIDAKVDVNGSGVRADAWQMQGGD